LSSICTANKRDGSPCTLPSYESSSLCWAHDPANAERRRRGQSRGGRSKPTKELISVKQRLSELADDVLEGNVDRADAAVTSQVLNVYLRAVSLELKVREQQEFEERIEQIEQAIERQQSNRWGRSL
jgi:LPS O-antigen subunit length determinant protein (WzzB/FepE family)